MNKIEEKHLEAIYDSEYEEIRHSAIYKMDFPKAAKACTEISIDGMKGFAKWLLENAYMNGTIQYHSMLSGEEGYSKTIPELIQKYIDTLNK